MWTTNNGVRSLWLCVVLLLVVQSFTPVEGDCSQRLKSFTFTHTVHDVLLFGGWSTAQQLGDMSEDERRNTLIVELDAVTSYSVADLQRKTSTGSLASLVGIAELAILIRDLCIRTPEDLSDMSYDDIRNTLIVEVATSFEYSGGYLQARNDAGLATLAVLRYQPQTAGVGAGVHHNEDDWFIAARRKYLIGPRMDREAAQWFCASKGGYLADMNCQEEQEDIVKFAQQNRQVDVHYWIGANDIAIEGQWVSGIDGSPLSFTGWFDGEPNSWDGYDEDCAILYEPMDFQWGDAACDARYDRHTGNTDPIDIRPMCEAELTAQTCYRCNTYNAEELFSEEKNSWLNSMFEGDFVSTALCMDEFADMENDTDYTILCPAGSCFQDRDVDGTETYGCLKERAESGLSLHSYEHGKWHYSYQHCNSDFCNRRGDSCTPNRCLNGGSCSVNGDAFTCICLQGYTGDTCQYVASGAWDVTCTGRYYLGPAMSRHSAEPFCRLQGGRLASVDSQKEQDILAMLARRQGGHFWIAANDIQREGNWVTLDGCPLRYNSWKKAWGEPNSWQGANEDCAALYEDADYEWVDAPCEAAFQVICEDPWQFTDEGQYLVGYEVNSSAASLCASKGAQLVQDGVKKEFKCQVDYTRDEPPKSDLEEWHSTSTGHYLLGSKMDREHGSSFCASKGGHLVDVNSQDEQNNVVEFAKRNRQADVHYWISANDIANEGHWVDSNGSPLSFTGWLAGEPNSWDGYDEDCAILFETEDFQQVDAACDARYDRHTGNTEPIDIRPMCERKDTLKCEILDCSSNGGSARQTCRFSIPDHTQVNLRIELVMQHPGPGAHCIPEGSFGLSGDQDVWVTNGCHGRFKICSGRGEAPFVCKEDGCIVGWLLVGAVVITGILIFLCVLMNKDTRSKITLMWHKLTQTSMGSGASFGKEIWSTNSPTDWPTKSKMPTDSDEIIPPPCYGDLPPSYSICVNGSSEENPPQYTCEYEVIEKTALSNVEI